MLSDQIHRQQFDELAGLYSLRARYYAPALGRFLSRDPFEGTLFGGRELNRYVYAANNPVNLADPSGRYILLQDAQTRIQTGMTTGMVAGFVGGLGAAMYFYGAAALGSCGDPLTEWALSMTPAEMWFFFAKSALIGAVLGAAAGGLIATGPYGMAAVGLIAIGMGVYGLTISGIDIVKNRPNLCNVAMAVLSVAGIVGGVTLVIQGGQMIVQGSGPGQGQPGGPGGGGGSSGDDNGNGGCPGGNCGGDDGVPPSDPDGPTVPSDPDGPTVPGDGDGPSVPGGGGGPPVPPGGGYQRMPTAGLRYTQNSCSPAGNIWEDGQIVGQYTIEENVMQLKNNPDFDLPPIRLFKMESYMREWGPMEQVFNGVTRRGDPMNLEVGQIYSLDNRRLLTYRLAGRSDIPVVWVDDSTVRANRFEFSTTDYGLTIEIEPWH